MVLLISDFPITSEKDVGPEAWKNLTEEKRVQLTITSSALIDLLSPLTQIRSREALEDLLHARVSRFLQLKLELIRLLWDSQLAQTQSDRSYDQMRQTILAKSDLLGEEALQQLLGTLDSSEAFKNWGIEGIGRGGVDAYRVNTVLEQVGGVTPLGNMCVDALMGVLTEHITDWVPEAIPVLAQAADDYMTEVEDVFLASSPESYESEEVVDFESLRKELGL